MGNVTALVGAQYGSEGKGAVAAEIAHLYDVHVRTGGPNAGHTFYHDYLKWVARGLPVGWVNPDASLVIGPGAVLDWELLLEEIDAVEGAGYPVRDRMYIDPRAVCVTAAQRNGEGGTGGPAHARIGSTGEGVGLARIAKISRQVLLSGEEYRTVHAKDVPQLGEMCRPFEYTREQQILLEGTQGVGLSLTTGHWPYVTSADTGAAQMLADAGLSPGWFKETILVARTYPIRVAGRSGPLFDELTWDEVGVPPEVTTVTRKVRRVGSWDTLQVAQAAARNEPVQLVVTFIDYINPKDKGVTQWDALSSKTLSWISLAQTQLAMPIAGVGTGPGTIAWSSRSPSRRERTSPAGPTTATPAGT